MGDFLVHIGSRVDDNVLSQVVMLQVVVVVVVCVCREVIFSAILSRLHIHVTSTNLKPHFLV